MSRNSGGSPPGARWTTLDDEDNVNTGRDDPKYRRAAVPDNISQGATPEFRLFSSTAKGNPLLYSDSPGDTLPHGMESISHPRHVQASSLHTPSRFSWQPRLNVDSYRPRTVGSVKPVQQLDYFSDIKYPIGGGPSSPFIGNDDKGFWSPFDAGAVGDGPDDDLVEDSIRGSMRVTPLPRTFRLERTNFVVQGSSGRRPALDELRGALEASLGSVGVDVLDFRGGDCVHECSYQRGNVFLGLWLRVFLPPHASSGQLYSVEQTVLDEQNAFLVEVQLREGDRLRFSAIFRELMKTFKDEDNDMFIKGTYRYQLRQSPATGEGLVLEEPSFPRARPGYTPLSTQRESYKQAVPQPTSMRRAQNEATGDILHLALPLPSEKFDRPGDDEELDDGAVEDITSLADMLGGQFLDVQSDAAGALAGITADANLLRSLSMPKCADLASTLCSAAAYLLTSTWHRPARRQGAVLVANLSTTQPLRVALLTDSTSHKRSIESSQSSVTRVGLIQFLVAKAMGEAEDRRHDAIASRSGVSHKSCEEEIGTRRECMRALVNFSTSAATRSDPEMLSLLSRNPTGRGGSDPVLQARLEECRDLLKDELPSSSP